MSGSQEAQPSPPPSPQPNATQPDQVRQLVSTNPHPVMVQCPYCNHNAVTSTKYEKGAGLSNAVCVTCLVTLICCQCYLGLIPYCLKGTFYDVHHHCQSCGRHLGTYLRPGCC